MYNPNNTNAIRRLLKTQKNIVFNDTKQDENPSPENTKKRKKILNKLNELEKLLQAEMPGNKFPQEIQFDGNSFNLVQNTNGGKYILWSSNTNPDYIQCGIGFTLNTKKTDFSHPDVIEEDLFMAETKLNEYAVMKNLEVNNKDIDYYLYQDPYTENYTASGQIEYSDIKEALEVE